MAVGDAMVSVAATVPDWLPNAEGSTETVTDGWRDAVGGRNRNSRRVGADAEGRVIATWIRMRDLFRGNAWIAEIAAKYHTLLLWHHPRLLRQAADGKNCDAAG